MILTDVHPLSLLHYRQISSCNMPSDFVILTWSAISFPFDRSLGAARKYPLRSGDAACRIRSARSFKPVSPERSGSSDPGETEGGLTPQIGRAHVWTPVTNAHLVCRLLLVKKKKYTG